MRLKTLEFNESLNTPYPYKWFTKTNAEGYARFTSDNDSVIHFHIYLDEAGGYTIDFTATANGKSTFELTNRGDAFRVMATIIKILEEYIKKYRKGASYFRFSADKSSSSDNGRTNLYKRLFKKYTPPGRWHKDIDKVDNSTYFTYYNKDEME